MSAITVRPATQAECVDILSEPRLLKLLEDSPSLEELPAWVVSNRRGYMLISCGKYRMLFEYFPATHVCYEGLYEYHVGCPKTSIVASRVLILASLEWLFKSLGPKAKALLTTCPEGKIANLCRKVGALEVSAVEGKLTFIATRNHLGLSLN